MLFNLFKRGELCFDNRFPISMNIHPLKRIVPATAMSSVLGGSLADGAMWWHRCKKLSTVATFFPRELPGNTPFHRHKGSCFYFWRSRPSQYLSSCAKYLNRITALFHAYGTSKHQIDYLQPIWRKDNIPIRHERFRKRATTFPKLNLIAIQLYLWPFLLALQYTFFIRNWFIRNEY